jgi:sugar fermentation stimulation protein A
MEFNPPLVRATLVRRYKRFLADVELADGTIQTAHVANSGKMLGLDTPGFPVWLAPGTGKLPWSVKFVEGPFGLAGVDTHLPNKLLAEALSAGALPEFTDYASVRAEVRYGAASRVDFLLTDAAGRRLWLEAKNVHLMRESGLAEFPDCAAARSARHMQELSAMVREGDRACALFVVQLPDAEAFSPAADLDPQFAQAFARARETGVEMLAYRCALSPEGASLAQRIEVR